MNVSLVFVITAEVYWGLNTYIVGLVADVTL